MKTNFNKIIKSSCDDLLVSEYSDFAYFLEVLHHKVNHMYEWHDVEDINCNYNKNNKTMRIAFLINDKSESLKTISLHSIRGYSSKTSSADSKVARKNKYYCNFTLKLDEMHDTVIKIKNLKASDVGIKKFNL